MTGGIKQQKDDEYMGYRNSTRLEDETKALIKTLKKHKNP